MPGKGHKARNPLAQKTALNPVNLELVLELSHELKKELSHELIKELSHELNMELKLELIMQPNVVNSGAKAQTRLLPAGS